MRRALTAALIAMAVLASLSVAQDAAPEKKLVGHWTFDDGEGMIVKDVSGCGHDGKILNKSRGAKWVEGRSGKAIEFTAGDPKKRNEAGCVQIPMPDVAFTQGVTVEVWVKFTAINRAQAYEIVSNTVSDRGKGFRLMLSWLSLRFGSGEGGAGKSWGAATSPAKTKIEPNVWYHLAATYNDKAYTVYLDGQEVAPAEHPAMTEGRKEVCIGAYNGGYAYGLDGVVDEVKIYNYARPAADILADARMSD